MIGATAHRTRALVVAAMLASGAGVVAAQPPSSMVEAKALMQSGLKLYAANDVGEARPQIS